MTYAQYLLIFLGGPLVILAALAWRRRAVLRARLPWAGLLALVVVAVVYTTPWDNYLVATGVWYYNPDLVASPDEWRLTVVSDVSDTVAGSARGTTEQQDLLVDRKVPRDERDRVPLVVSADDRIVWVAGQALAADFAVSPAATGVLLLKFRRSGGKG